MERLKRTIVVTSGKGGVCKTTITANIGGALALLGMNVLLVDADVGLRNLDLVLGLENRIVFDLLDVIEKRCRSYKQAIIKDKRINNLFLLPSPQTKQKEDVPLEKFKELINEIREDFDFVIIDCPAGIEHGFKMSAISAEEAIVVTTPDMSSIRDADRVIANLESMEKKSTKLIINRFKKHMVKKSQMLSVEDIIETLNIEILGIIPDDEYITISTNNGEPVVLNKTKPLFKYFNNIAQRIIDPNIPTGNPLEEGNILLKFANLVGIRKSK
ncbi:MAG: septum site-determining protein MinD [bacterium]